MNEDAMLRRENLNRLCKARGWGASDLARLFTGRYTYWRDLLTDHTKPFGEKKARALEQEAGLPRLWFDMAQPEVPPPTPQAPAVLTAREPVAPYHDWPLSLELLEALRKLNKEELIVIERIVRMFAKLPIDLEQGH